MEWVDSSLNAHIFIGMASSTVNPLDSHAGGGRGASGSGVGFIRPEAFWARFSVLLGALQSGRLGSGNAGKNTGENAEGNTRRRARLVDVRSRAEFAGERVCGFESIPLDELDPRQFQQGPEAGRGGTGGGETGGSEVYLLCQGGVRATRAAQRLLEAGVACSVIEGGLNAWKGAGLPVEHGGGRMMPVMQQTQLVLGVLGALGSALALWKDPRFAVLPLFLGCGLIFAGLTGWCGLALLLARMPWNRRGVGSSVLEAAPTKSGPSCCSGPAAH